MLLPNCYKAASADRQSPNHHDPSCCCHCTIALMVPAVVVAMPCTMIGFRHVLFVVVHCAWSGWITEGGNGGDCIYRRNFPSQEDGQARCFAFVNKHRQLITSCTQEKNNNNDDNNDHHHHHHHHNPCCHPHY